MAWRGVERRGVAPGRGEGSLVTSRDGTTLMPSCTQLQSNAAVSIHSINRRCSAAVSRATAATVRAPSEGITIPIPTGRDKKQATDASRIEAKQEPRRSKHAPNQATAATALAAAGWRSWSRVTGPH